MLDRKELGRKHQKPRCPEMEANLWKDRAVHEGDDLRIELCMREMIFVLK
jgi:hypothetical protein